LEEISEKNGKYKSDIGLLNASKDTREIEISSASYVKNGEWNGIPYYRKGDKTIFDFELRKSKF